MSIILAFVLAINLTGAQCTISKSSNIETSYCEDCNSYITVVEDNNGDLWEWENDKTIAEAENVFLLYNPVTYDLYSVCVENNMKTFYIEV